MRKNYLHVLFAVVLLLIVGICLVACGGGDNGKEGNTTPSGNDSTDQTSVGWTDIANVVQKDMYQSLLLGATNVASELSKSKIDKNNAVTIDGKLCLVVNGNDLWLSVKGKYDQTDRTKIREKAMLAVELYTDESLSDESRQVGAYVYMNELYLSLGTNKVKFSLKNANWPDYFPFDLPDITSQISNIASLLPRYIKLSSVNGQYRRNSNKEEYKYAVDVNVSETLSGLCAFLNDEKLFDNRELATILKTFAADVLNVTVEQLEQGEVSDSSLSVGFTLSGNQIQNMSATAKIALGKDAKYLMGSDELDLVVKIDDLTTSSNYSTGTKIPFINDTKGRQQYVSYSEAIYSLKVPVKQFGENFVVLSEKYNLKVTTRVFQDEQSDNFFFCEYCDRRTGKAERAIYFYNDVAYIYILRDGAEEMECICKFDINLSELATNIVTNNLVEERSEIDVYGLIAYILKNLSISEREISFALNKDFFTKVWYNFYDMLDNINEIAPEDLYENEEVVDFVRYIVNTGEIVIIGYNDDELVKIIDEDNEDVNDIVEMLAEESNEIDE